MEEQGEQPADRVGVEVTNDFDSMEEVVLRRYRRLLEEGGPFPDLVVVDGGRGQLTDVQQPRYGQQVLDVLFPF